MAQRAAELVVGAMRREALCVVLPQTNIWGSGVPVRTVVAARPGSEG